MVADIEFESAYKYDPSIDYDAVVERFNQLLKDGPKEERDRLLQEHGGIISICAKRQYQHDLLTSKTIIR